IDILGQQSVDPKTTDYKALMTKLAAVNDSFPAMMIYAGISDPSNAALLLKYKIEYMGDNFKVKWMGLDSLQDQAFIDAAGANQAEGAYATFNRLLKAELPPDGQAFLEEYARKYGPIASSLAPYGYESVSVVINAIENICSYGGDPTDRAAVRAEVMATKNFSGVLGTWSFDKYGDTTLSDMTGFVVKQGEYVPVDGINANH
ncbi:MAG TPA: ABC transporter substrate-binding protein, partial [Anaerolineae bacterium]|nr:ABC transporter substrate-binding protein [Anaerolineae bacterium]